MQSQTISVNFWHFYLKKKRHKYDALSIQARRNSQYNYIEISASEPLSLKNVSDFNSKLSGPNVSLLKPLRAKASGFLQRQFNPQANA